MKNLLYFLTIIACSKTCDADAIDYVACNVTTDCPDSQWCAFHLDGYEFCKDYAGLGEPCNFFTLPENAGVCDSRIHTCYAPMDCMIPDMGGTCMEEEPTVKKIGACCVSDDECESGFCDTNEEFSIWSLCQKSSLPISNVTNEELPPVVPVSNVTNEEPLPLVPIENETEEEAQAFCLVGDIAYDNGDTIGHIGYECLDDSNYEAMQSICQNGTVVKQEITETCPESAPVCYQCGERGMGNALCMTSQSNSTTSVSSSRINGNTCMIGSEWATFTNNTVKITNSSSQSSADFEQSDPVITFLQEETISSSSKLNRMRVVGTVFGSILFSMFMFL